jgi:hypothetical protein
LEHGRSPTIKELGSFLKKSDEDIIRALDELEKKGDFLLRKKGTQEIVSIYPFSLIPTEHQIILEDGTKLFAMCAVDALGTPIMFNKNVRIVSRCEQCKQEVTVEIENEEIASLSHPNLMICSPKSQVYPAAEITCPLVNFFCSKKCADEWIVENPQMMDNINQGSVKQVFSKIRDCWKGYGEMLGFRRPVCKGFI